MTRYLDTNVIIRHFVGEPADQARGAASYLVGDERVTLTDVVVTECVHVLESFYELPPVEVSRRLRAVIGLPTVKLENEDRVLRALELYELWPLAFTDAYLVACAELSPPAGVVSFDRDFDRIPSVDRIEPS